MKDVPKISLRGVLYVPSGVKTFDEIFGFSVRDLMIAKTAGAVDLMGRLGRLANNLEVIIVESSYDGSQFPEPSLRIASRIVFSDLDLVKTEAGSAVYILGNMSKRKGAGQQEMSLRNLPHLITRHGSDGVRSEIQSLVRDLGRRSASLVDKLNSSGIVPIR